MIDQDKLPAPPLPSETDLRDFVFMPLDVVRLRDSGIAVHASGDGFRAAVLLWCASWHQVPAASLPDDDAILAQLAGYGRVVKEWKKVRNEALRGWVKCSDGLLYHPVVAEKAAEAWTQKQDHRARREAERKRKADERERRRIEEVARQQAGQVAGNPAETIELSGGRADSVRRTDAGNPAENALKGQGEVRDRDRDRDRDRNIKPSSSESSVPCTEPPEESQPPENATRKGALCKQLRALGIDAAPHLQGWSEMLPAYSDAEILAAAEQAREKKPGERLHLNYLLPILRNRAAPPTSRNGKPEKFDPVAYVNRNRISAQRSVHAPGNETVDVTPRRVD